MESKINWCQLNKEEIFERLQSGSCLNLVKKGAWTENREAGRKEFSQVLLTGLYRK